MGGGVLDYLAIGGEGGGCEGRGGDEAGGSGCCWEVRHC